MHYITAEGLEKAKQAITPKVSVVKSGEKEIYYDFLINAYTVVTPLGVKTTEDTIEAVDAYNKYQE